MKLRFAEAQELISKERSLHKDNLLPVYLDNYIDFLSVIISEDQLSFDQLKSNKASRIKLLEQGDPNSPYYRYLLADSYLQWAFARLKFEEYFTAAWEIRKAYVLLEDNQKRFPDFSLNRGSLGLLHALIGTVPDSWKWAVNLVGMQGTIKQGITELEIAINDSSAEGQLFKQRNLIVYTFMIMHLGKQEEEAWALISSEKVKLGDNLLNHFVAANVAIRSGHNDEAIEILSSRPGGKEYYPFLYLDYMLGLARLNRLDKDAKQHLSAYVDHFKGVNYIKDSYQKLAWHALIFGDPTAYDKYMQLCLSSGYAVIDADKQAMLEASSGRKPKLILLKARLLFDGGYYSKAMSVLEGKSASDFEDAGDQLEFTYRVGRIYHEWGKIDKAIPFYKLSMKLGADSEHYFAANSALQLGLIYENKNDKELAQKYFKWCLNSKGHAYKNSLDQKAKSGLDRLK